METENLPDSDADRAYEMQADSIKADIDVKDKKETMLAKLKYRLKLSEQNTADKIRDWEKNLKLFEGKHWEISGAKIPSYRANIVVNKWFAAVRSLVAFETDAKPDTEVEVCVSPKDPNVDILWEQAAKVDQALDYNWDLLGIQNTVTEILYDRYNYADGFGMYFWDDEIDNVNFEQIKPQELLVSPGATCIDDAEFVILCRYRNKKWFDKNFPDADISYNEYHDKVKDTSRYFNMAKVYNYFEDELWITFTEKEVLDVMPNPYWEWRTDEEQQKEMIDKYGVIPPDWQPIHNHLTKPEKPIIHFKGYHLAGDFYSQDLAGQAMQLNFAFNKRKCQIQDNADAMANGQWVVDPTYPEEKARLITSQPGLVIRANPGLVRKEQGISIPEFVFADMQHTEQKFDDMLGHHDVSKGVSSTKRQTRTEVLMLRESDITPVRLMMRNTELAESRLLNGWVQLMKLFYDNEHYVGGFGESAGTIRATITRNDIPDNLSIIIKVGSTIPVSKEARRQEYERWTMSGMMDLKTFYEKMGEANPEKLANRAMNARMGVLADTPPQPPIPQGQPNQGGQSNAS